jgi:hypothetical protein
MPLKDKDARRKYQRRYQRAWYHKNRQKHLRFVREHEKVSTAFLEATRREFPCLCGESDSACLDFHHVGGKEKGLPGRLWDGWSIDRIVRELSKCDVLCSNCHRKLHRQLNNHG